MSKIDDNTFVRFIMNDLTKEEMQETETQLQKDGEGVAILACSTALWETTPQAIDIVGDVKRKITSIKDRYKISQDSILANEHKNSIAMVQLTKEDGKAIKRITEEYFAFQDSSLTLEENLKKFYCSECPGDDADSIIAGIKEGITRFDSAFSQMVSADDFEVEKITEEALEGKSLEEKYNILLNFLVALNTLQAENIKSEDGSYSESFDQIKERLYSAGVPVTEEMVAELIEKIKGMMENGICTLTSAEAVDGLLNSLSVGEEEVKIFLANQEDLFQQKMILSTAIMIGVRNNTIESLQGQEVSPQVIGAGVSAGLEQQKLMADLQAGNSTLITALKILKYIGGAALLCAGLYWGVLTVLGISGVVAAWVMSIVGVSTMACIISWLTTFLFITWPLTEVYTDALFYVMDKTGSFFNWVMSKIRGKSNADESTFVEWLKFKIETGEVVENDIQTEQSETVFA